MSAVITTTVNNHKHSYTKQETLFRLSTIAVLCIVGYLFLLIGKFDFLSTSLYMMWEFSDLVVLIALSLYGIIPALSVSVIKMLLFFLTFFNGKFYPIDPMFYALFVSSICMVSFYFSFDFLVRFFKRHMVVRIFFCLICTVFIALIMTALSYLYFTPMHFNDNRTTDISRINIELIFENNPTLFPDPNRSFLSYIFQYHFSYYLIKYAVIFTLFELIDYFIIEPYMKSEYFGNYRYFFTNENDFRIPYHILSFRKFSNDHFRKKELSSRRLQWMKRSNAKKALYTNEKQNEDSDYVVKENYLYNIEIEENGTLHTEEIKTNRDGSLLIMNYMKNSYPNIHYKVTSYREENLIVKDASSDGLSPELFKQVNHCDKEVTKVIGVQIVIQKKRTKKGA